MLRILVGLAFIPMTLLAFSAFGEEEVFRHLDVSDGNHEGHWIMFFSKAMAANAPMGTVGVAVGKGDSFEGAFGMIVKSSKPTLGAATEEEIKALRDDEKAPAATITLIDVSPEQYAAAKEAVDVYSAREEHVDRQTDVAMNFAFDVFKNLPLKRPYRSGLGGANVIIYYSDIGLLNRKLAKTDS